MFIVPFVRGAFRRLFNKRILHIAAYSLPHGTNKKLKCETKNKTMSMIGPFQSRCHEGSPVGKRSLRWERFVEKVGFRAWSERVKE